MKKAKLIMAASMITLGAFSMVGLSSCGKDLVCEVGYEGDDCKTLMRDKFVGKWTGKDICAISGEHIIDMKAERSDVNELNVLIENGAGSGDHITITGTIVNSTTLEFKNQDLGDGYKLFEGEMKISASGNDLSFSYTTDYKLDNDTESCNGTYTRQ